MEQVYFGLYTLCSITFMAYEPYRSRILDNYSALGTGPIVDLLACSAAGGTAVLCIYPLDLAHTKLAYQVVDTRGNLQHGARQFNANPAYTGIGDVFRRVYKDGSVRGLYRGIGPTLIGILPYAGLKFYVYEELKRHIPEEHQKSIVMRLPCEAMAGVLGQTLTYPLNVVRRQMQVLHHPLLLLRLFTSQPSPSPPSQSSPPQPSPSQPSPSQPSQSSPSQSSASPSQPSLLPPSQSSPSQLVIINKAPLS